MLSVNMRWTGAAAGAEPALGPLRALGRPAVDAVAPRAYAVVQASQDPYWTPGAQNYWKADYLSGLDEASIDALVEAAASFTSAASDIKLAALGGVLSRIPEDATAYGHRDARILLNINTRWEAPGAGSDHVGWTRTLWGELHRLAVGVYVNFLGEEGDARIVQAYGREKYHRLAQIKARWDPDNLFRVNQNIRPSEVAGHPEAQDFRRA